MPPRGARMTEMHECFRRLSCSGGEDVVIAGERERNHIESRQRPELHSLSSKEPCSKNIHTVVQQSSADACCSDLSLDINTHTGARVLISLSLRRHQ